MDNGNEEKKILANHSTGNFIHILDFRLIKQLCRQTRFINGTDPSEEEEEEELSVDTLNSFE